MQLRLLPIVSLLFMLVVLFSRAVSAQEPTPWQVITPSDDAICANGTPYQFFVRDADPEKVMIHFQGGGACWDENTCASGLLFDNTVAESDLDEFQAGVFDFNNPANPVADYTSVVVSYCSGDIHVGEASNQYGDTEIQHQGVPNVQSVLTWVFDNYPSPQEVFINGCSAGSYGAIFYAPQIIDQYSEANVVHLGEGGVGVMVDNWVGLRNWSFFDHLATYFPNLNELAPEDFSINLLYEAAAQSAPDAFFTQYTTTEDVFQSTFYALMGGMSTEWVGNAQQMLSELDTIENFASYVHPGNGHCILASPDFYDNANADQVSFVDWLGELLTEGQISSVGDFPQP